MAGPIAAKRFVKSMQKCLDATCLEIDDRNDGRVRPIEDYFLLRRHNSGIVPSFHINERASRRLGSMEPTSDSESVP